MDDVRFLWAYFTSWVWEWFAARGKPREQTDNGKSYAEGYSRGYEAGVRVERTAMEHAPPLVMELMENGRITGRAVVPVWLINKPYPWQILLTGIDIRLYRTLRIREATTEDLEQQGREVK